MADVRLEGGKGDSSRLCRASGRRALRNAGGSKSRGPVPALPALGEPGAEDILYDAKYFMMRKPRGSKAIPFLSSLFGLLLACTVPPPTQSLILRPNSRLLSQVTLWIPHGSERGRVTFYPSSTGSWRDLLIVDPCGPFHPGMTFSEAESRFGEPMERGRNHLGPFVIYERDRFQYLVGSYTFATGGIPFLLPDEEASYDKWILQTHPLDNPVEKVFHAEVAAYIDGRREEFTIMAGADEGPAIHGRLAGRKVHYLYPVAPEHCRDQAR